MEAILTDATGVALALIPEEKVLSAAGKYAKVLKSTGLVKKVNGRLPINSKYAGKVYHFDDLPKSLKARYPNLKRDYPHGIPFTSTGFPDFSRYAIKKVKIKVTGNRTKDEILANKAAELSKKPDGYTWHHHQDGVTMQLVPVDLHRAFRHTGGVAKTKGASK